MYTYAPTKLYHLEGNKLREPCYLVIGDTHTRKQLDDRWCQPKKVCAYYFYFKSLNRVEYNEFQAEINYTRYNLSSA